MPPDGKLPMPCVSAWDPRAIAVGSIDPLGALRPFTAIAGTLLPGVTTITSRVRYLSWVCAGLRLLDEVPTAPQGGQAGRARRQRLLPWERLVALATGTYAMQQEAAVDDPAWSLLRGVSYVRRAVADGVHSPDFAMLRNQGGTGGIGTYWVTLVAGGLVEGDSGALTSSGQALADAFLKVRRTPDRARLRSALASRDPQLTTDELATWGAVAHLDAAGPAERRLLADALLQPPAHRRMAAAMQGNQAQVSNGTTLQRLATRLRKQKDPHADQLAAVLAVTLSFEHLHRALLYQFHQLLALDWRRPTPLKNIRIQPGPTALADLGKSLRDGRTQHRALLPSSVASALGDFAGAIEPILSAANRPDRIRHLVRHHERVQGGKLDASRQPKVPWIELDGDRLKVSPRYALDERPAPPGEDVLTHPYRIEQFAGLLDEAGAWETGA